MLPPGGEGWTIRDYRAILRSEPYASADLGAASDVTTKSVQSEAASASSPSPISPQLTSDVIAATRDAPVPWAGSIVSGGKQRDVPGGHTGTIQSRCAPIGTVSSHGLFAIYPRFYVATNTSLPSADALSAFSLSIEKISHIDSLGDVTFDPRRLNCFNHIDAMCAQERFPATQADAVASQGPIAVALDGYEAVIEAIGRIP